MGLFGKSRHAHLMISAAVGALTLGANAAWAQTKPITIEPQALASALHDFGAQTGRQVMFTPESTASKMSRGVSGATDEDVALAQLLDGTGLTYRREANIFLITRASDPQSGSAAGDGAEQGTVQALIVTAQKREENIQDVPIAMSAFTQEDLTKSQVAGGPDLMTQVPNFTFTKTNFSGYSIQIRGIGTQAISVTTDPAVAVAFNNTPFVRNRFFEQEFYDLERVEVLRGPQGTLYGRNATAGVVNMISAKPKNHYEARLSGDVGNYNSTRFEGMINLPLVEDKAALRIAGAWTKRDGYVKNLIDGQQTDGRDLWSTRATLGLRPADWLDVNLIWEHFSEKDDRLRSGKQMCRRDPIEETDPNQGCLPASLYSPDSFQVPNGHALAYYGVLNGQGAPGYQDYDPYLSHYQSRNLREIETRIKPEYNAKSDVFELQAKLDLPHDLSFTSETAFSTDHIFSFEDYNRFNTAPHAFRPGSGIADHRGPQYDIVDQNGVFCDPQLGCSDRLMAGDLDTAKSRQFSQEFRLSSDFEGPFNFSLGANFLRYDTVEKYYVFINNITGFYATEGALYSANGYINGGIPSPWVPGVTDNSQCVNRNFYGQQIVNDNPDNWYVALGCGYIDPNDIHHLNDNGRNYFLSKNPYHLSSYAAFGEAYYNVTPDLKITAGLRWTVDQKTSPQIPSWLTAATRGPTEWGSPTGATYGLPVRKVIYQEWREPTGRLAIDWKPKLSFTDETLVYGSYVRGYKAGGSNPPPPVVVTGTICPPQCDGHDGGPNLLANITNHYINHPETFAPEFVNAYEVGTKNTLLEGRLTTNLSAFYYDYTGYQISEIVDRSALNRNFDAKVWGGELEVDWRPLENFRLGFKGGYENTRVAKGMKEIDLMDRTAGMPGWRIKRPFPTMPSNCVVPVDFNIGCEFYIAGVDPVTWLPYVPNPTVDAYGNTPPAGYAGFDPASANYGNGFYKDLSGHQLPNAPKFTATITADYTLPLANAWLMTLHTDLYYQSEAWTRIFNDPGYDKLKAYNNVNIAAIFSNEDAGWQVMAYVKNVLNKDNITGAFLNSDDTGLTTNVFLNEPRLYGLRVTKNWSGGPMPWNTQRPDGSYLFGFEIGGQMQREDAPTGGMTPFAGTLSQALDPRSAENVHFDWNRSQEMRLTYRPSSPWRLTAGFRYGRTAKEGSSIKRQQVAGPQVCAWPFTGPFGLGHAFCDADSPSYNSYWVLTPYDRLGATFRRNEEHLVADFTVGRDVGFGVFGIRQSLSGGLRGANLESRVSGTLTAATDLQVPDGSYLGRFFPDPQYKASFRRLMANFEGEQKFQGIGPELSWEGAKDILGNDGMGHLSVDGAVTAGVLFGKQKAHTTGVGGNEMFSGVAYPTYSRGEWGTSQFNPMPAPTMAPLDIRNSKSVTVPVVDLSLGLSYQITAARFGVGYRWERYFNAIGTASDGAKSYDRTIDGPYFKISVGFGG